MKIEFQNIPVSEKLDQVVEKSMEQIYTQQKRKRVKLWAVKGSAIAAVFVMVIFTFISNLSIAAELPFIGHIFERMQENFGYKGDYSGVGEPLEAEIVGFQLDNAENAEEIEALSEYTQTVDGVTVTLSEVYCNNQALYITVQIKSEEPLPETYNFQCRTLEQYSFTSNEIRQLVDVEGGKIDDYTYAGVMRFDLNSRNVDLSAYLKEVEKQKEQNFTLDLCIENIAGYLVDPEPIDWGKTPEELETMSDEEWDQFVLQYEAEHPDLYDGWKVTYEGTWNFALDITMNLSETQVVELNDYNELGIGFEKVVKERFEITMYEAYKDESKRFDYFPVMLDADGRLMQAGGSGGSVNTVAIEDRNVSRVDIFLIDYDEWMNELKVIYWNELNALPEGGETFREILLERCAYHREIVFE